MAAPRFFTPMADGTAGEESYQGLRQEIESEMGRAPNRRRIVEIWTRRGNRDCVTTVGSPDPVRGGTVTAIFDMGPHQPFIVYRRHPTEPDQQTSEILGCNAYAVSEFSP